MSTSRSESQAPQFGGRHRSNTAQSVLKGPPVVPLRFGDSKLLVAWVHDPKESPTITLNQTWWPGVAEGDLLHLSSQQQDEEPSRGLLHLVPKDEGNVKHQLQISIPRPIAEKFGLKTSSEIVLTKVNPVDWAADHIELVFQDQYLGRNEMWRLERHLVGQCVYVDQEISFIGVIAAKVQAIYIRGKKVSTGCVTPQTKAIFRSLSAKVTIFIQVCRELWNFAGDGERYYEKIVHSFLPALFTKWHDAGTTHIVTIVLISRVYYDDQEITYAAGPVRQDDEGKWYKDFFKVITDLEIVYDWKPTLVSLKDSFWDFQRDILLAHHHHRSPGGASDQARLVGRLSKAHKGPILEALNLGFNPTETHYIDRSLSLTGSATIIITPGTGYFRVDKQLLRLTTTRLLDQGFSIELVSLTKPPLHQSPVFCFRGAEPDLRPEYIGRSGARSLDPLWSGDDLSTKEMNLFWWEPFWMSVSFWDKQMDLPFREDRFIARARMQEIEMMGLLDHDVLSSTALPYLPDLRDPSTVADSPRITTISKEDADRYDMDVFAVKHEPKILGVSRNSVSSTASGSFLGGSVRSDDVLRRSFSNRAVETKNIPPIQESPHRPVTDLPSDTPPMDSKRQSASSTAGVSSSRLESCMRSGKSEKITKSTIQPATPVSPPSRPSTGRATTRSIFSPSWFFSQFRGSSQTPSHTSQASGSVPMKQDQPSLTSASASLGAKSIQTTGTSTVTQQTPRSPIPMNIKFHSVGRSGLRHYDEDSLHPHRASLPRHSPLGTPPRDEPAFGKRRSGTLSSGMAPLVATSPPIIRTNPLKPSIVVPYVISSLAQRWQHMFAQPLSKHNIKWKAMVTPGCLPLTVEYFPSSSELESSYDVFSYEFVVDPPEMRSFLIRPPSVTGNSDTIRRAWALVVMRGMVALRLAQGFQFVLRPSNDVHNGDSFAQVARRSTMYVSMDDVNPRPAGAAEVLQSPDDPVYLSMSNEIHRISYRSDTVQVRRHVRRMPRVKPYEYECLIWPKLGVGYTELTTTFQSHGLENYGWNRLDMLVAGYENQFSESLRYWRTRFLVIPSDDLPISGVSTLGPAGERLNDEEIRLLGMDKLADLFSRVRWVPPEDKGKSLPPVRFIPTDLEPVSSVLDEPLVARLDEIHASGPLKKKMKSERDIGDMTLSAIAKAMREEDGVPIKDHKWHRANYPNSFTGADFVSWLVREFRDVSTREQATEWGVKLQEQGLFEHCRGAHGFLDGHYFYVLRGEYSVAMTPRSGGWFRSNRHVSGEEQNVRAGGTSSLSGRIPTSGRRAKKRLILSQSMVIDIDPNKAECILLHHDIIHNPATCFHFELQWIGTTARCIDDILRQWSRTIEKYGLKLVEGYVSEISDIRDRNPFQSCCPIPLAVSPPSIPDLENRIPDGTQTVNYFESALLRRFGFVLDIEAGNLYPEQIDVIYSYRRVPYTYSQWVHRSGVAFVQVLGGSKGYLFLTNRLMAAGRISTAQKIQRPAAAADELRLQLQKFCSDPVELQSFYDEEIAHLDSHPLEDPPPLTL
ncbi:unnamed protein product [Somion occarium]|uniref:Vacuolar membrane-associated protein IML1 n=1 Tax=Somion occarium TaxID=3059160 RepID=A0ABP1DVJ4_9APHY